MERWIEIEDGVYPDGYPKSRYKHESCKVNEKTVSSVYPYCPYCGKKIAHVKVLKNGLHQYLIEYLEKQGFICE